MDLVNLLSKLQAIEVQETKELVGGQKKLDKDKDGDIDKDDFAHMRKQKNEDIFNVLKGLKAIQEGPEDEDEGNEEQERVFEASDKCDDCGEVHEGACDKSKVEECGDMEMSPLTNPTAGYDMAPMSAMAQQAEPEMAAEPEEAKPMFTLTVTNGENNLTMRTDVPEEIMHVMKLAGVGAKAEFKKAEPEGQEKEVEEAWANTPDNTNEREPKPYGDIRDWGFKGTGKGQPGYGDRRAPGQGDNPLAETAIMNEYKSFKAKK
jgi:hypothetical protein